MIEEKYKFSRKIIFKKFNKRKFLLRLISFPFWLILLLIANIYIAFHAILLYLWYGGELINYTEDDSASIWKIYNELRNSQKTN